MKLLAVYALFGSVALALAGCGGMSMQRGQTVAIGNISNLPQTLLNGAELEHARSVAMGTARSKGWTIKEAAANQLLLERGLSSDSPQAAALAAGNLVTPPKIEVETNLAERRDGTIVALRAFMVTNPGTSDEQRIDYTSDFENELLISLSSLQSAWIQNRARVTSVVPLPSELDAEQQDVSRDGGAEAEALPVGTAVAAAESAPVAEMSTAPVENPPAAAVSPVAGTSPDTSPSPGARASQVAQATPTPAADTTPIARTQLPPPSSGGLPETARPAAPATGVAAVPRNDMLVLNESTRKGLWSYYAEDYARLRGCAIGDRGAMLLQETPTFELHEVECVGAANVMVKCQGGVCEPMR